MRDNEGVIELRHVSKSYGGVRALVDASLQLRGGEVVVIEGANGSGKSTLLGILGTLIRPTSGRIDYGELGTTLEQVRSGIGWVGHDTLCYGDLTAHENLALAARLANAGDDAVERARARFGLGEFASRPVRTYSRGQRQRVALARALVQRPRLLLLDEPSTGLDAKTTQQLVDVVGEEAKAGTAVVVVTHDAQFAHTLKATRYQMDRGRLRVSPAASAG
jgi:heme exporter protein A